MPLTSRLFKMWGSIRYRLISSKTLLHSSIQPNVCDLYRVVKKIWSLLVNQVINQPKAVRRPICRRISFLVDGMGISRTQFTWSGFILIPYWVTKKPRNLPALTPNAHLSELSFILYFSIRPNAFFKYWTFSARVLLLMTMSLMYISIVHPINGLKIFVINLWYVAPAFFSLNDMTL